MSPAYQRVAVTNGGCWKGSRHRRQGRLDCFLSRDGAQVAAKRDRSGGASADCGGRAGRSGMGMAGVCSACLLLLCTKAVNCWPSLSQTFWRLHQARLGRPAWGECVGEIGRRRVEGEVRRVLRIGVHVCAGTSRALCEIVYGIRRVSIAQYAWIHTPRWSMERAAGEVD